MEDRQTRQLVPLLPPRQSELLDQANTLYVSRQMPMALSYCCKIPVKAKLILSAWWYGNVVATGAWRRWLAVNRLRFSCPIHKVVMPFLQVTGSASCSSDTLIRTIPSIHLFQLPAHTTVQVLNRYVEDVETTGRLNLQWEKLRKAF